MTADRVIDTKTEDRNSSVNETADHLRGNTWTQSDNADKTSNNAAISDKKFLCFSHEDGQYIERKDLNRMKDQMEQLMQFEAKEISDANNGAFVMLRGGIDSIYKNSFCSDGAMHAEDAMAGTGKLEGPLTIPDADVKAINKNLDSFAHKYNVSVHGEMPKDYNELDIKAFLKVTDGDPRKALAEYHQDRTVLKTEKGK